MDFPLDCAKYNTWLNCIFASCFYYLTRISTDIPTTKTEAGTSGIPIKRFEKLSDISVKIDMMFVISLKDDSELSMSTNHKKNFSKRRIKINDKLDALRSFSSTLLSKRFAIDFPYTLAKEIAFLFVSQVA